MPIPAEYVCRGVRIPRTEGVFHFHRRREGHGDGCVVRTWKISGKSELARVIRYGLTRMKKLRPTSTTASWRR